jgi:hypothetical protein
MTGVTHEADELSCTADSASILTGGTWMMMIARLLTIMMAIVMPMKVVVIMVMLIGMWRYMVILIMRKTRWPR